MSLCYYVFMLLCYYAIMLLCYYAIMLLCCFMIIFFMLNVIPNRYLAYNDESTTQNIKIAAIINMKINPNIPNIFEQRP